MRSFKSRMGKEEGRGGGREGRREWKEKQGERWRRRERHGRVGVWGVLGIFRDVIYILHSFAQVFFFFKKNKLEKGSEVQAY